MTTTLNLFPATVRTATHQYDKAKFASRLGDGGSIVASIKGRDGSLLRAERGTIVSDGGRSWTFTAEGGEVWQITKQRGCGCGGTIVTAL